MMYRSSRQLAELPVTQPLPGTGIRPSRAMLSGGHVPLRLSPRKSRSMVNVDGAAEGSSVSFRPGSSDVIQRRFRQRFRQPATSAQAPWDPVSQLLGPMSLWYKRMVDSMGWVLSSGHEVTGADSGTWLAWAAWAALARCRPVVIKRQSNAINDWLRSRLGPTWPCLWIPRRGLARDRAGSLATSVAQRSRRPARSQPTTVA